MTIILMLAAITTSPTNIIMVLTGSFSVRLAAIVTEPPLIVKPSVCSLGGFLAVVSG